MSEQANTPVKTLIQEGDKTNYPPVGSMIEMHYSGYLYDPSKPDNKGNKSVFHCYAAHLGALHLKKKRSDQFFSHRFDSSYDRGTPLASKIGVGRLIQGTISTSIS